MLVGTIPLGTMSFSGLAPIYLVAAVGGVVAALIAPKYKVLVALGTGALFPAIMYFFAASTYKYAHYDTLLMSWTLGLPIAYLLGGLIGSRAIVDRPRSENA
jgi:hypothetical protein